jgi:hypothetical protein
MALGGPSVWHAWHRVWDNLHTVVLTDSVISTWYTVIPDIIPTNVRLADIQIAPTQACARCGNLDTLRHRIVTCEEGRVMWSWTRARLAAILRVSPSSIFDDWTLRPDFHFWPPPRHAAIIWILAHLVFYRVQASQRLSLKDYMDFLRRARWKQHQRPPKCQQTGRYLDILGWEGHIESEPVKGTLFKSCITINYQWWTISIRKTCNGWVRL